MQHPYKDILDSCVHPNSWQRFREEPHLDVMSGVHILLTIYVACHAESGVKSHR